MGRRAKKPTEKDLKEIEVLAGLGLTQEQIADLKDICTDTLRKYSMKAWKQGKAKAIAKVSETAYKMATSGNNTAMTIFYLKTQAGWSEPHEIPELLLKLLGVTEEELYGNS